MTPAELSRLTAKSPFECLPDGRPKVPDTLLEKLRTTEIAIEDMMPRARGAGYTNQN